MMGSDLSTYLYLRALSEQQYGPPALPEFSVVKPAQAAKAADGAESESDDDEEGTETPKRPTVKEFSDAGDIAADIAEQRYRGNAGFEGDDGFWDEFFQRMETMWPTVRPYSPGPQMEPQVFASGEEFVDMTPPSQKRRRGR